MSSHMQIGDVISGTMAAPPNADFLAASPESMFHKQNRLKIIAKLRRTIRPFKTYTSKEYLQVFKNSFIAG